MRNLRLILAVVLALPVMMQAELAHAQYAIGANFTSSGITGYVPPDSMGTVGPGHVVTLINGGYRVHDKTGNELMNSTLDEFWTLAGANYTSFTFDPRVAYDPVAERFYATAVDNSGGNNHILVAVSQSNNPLDGWQGFALDSSSANTHWADFPQLGFDQDHVYIGATMARITGLAFTDDQSLLVIPKSDFLSATPTLSSADYLENQKAALDGKMKWQPVQDFSQTNALDVHLFASDIDEISQAQVTDLGGSYGLNLRTGASVLPATEPEAARQPDGAANLESGDLRVRSAVTHVDGTYWGIHGIRDIQVIGTSPNVTVDLGAGLRWFQLDEDGNLLQEGRIRTQGMDFIYGSIAANAEGNVVIGFTGTSPDQYASAMAVVGTTEDGMTSFGDPFILKEGVAGYELIRGGRNRWGDYSATVVDPTNPDIFWTFQEWAVGPEQWAVQATQIIVPEPASICIIGVGGLLLIKRRVLI